MKAVLFGISITFVIVQALGMSLGPCVGNMCPDSYICVNGQCHEATNVSPTPPSTCVDTGANCPDVKPYCNDPLYFNSAVSVCRKTCGFCTDSTPTPAHCSAQGDGTNTFNDSNRAFVLQSFNNFKSQLAKGNMTMYNSQKAPSGSNIVKMTYNCELEAQAQQLANSCNQMGTITNIVNVGVSLGTGAKINEAISAIVSWRVDLVKGASNDVRFKEVTGALTPWIGATQIGCGFNPNCNMPLLRCYFSPALPSWNSTLYTSGAPCSSDAHCTLPGFGKCDISMGLCDNKSSNTPTTPPTTTTTPVPTQCFTGNGVTTFNDGNRAYITGRFNSYRSQAALGKYIMENGQKTPSGSNMIKLTYNCALENQAQPLASSCNTNGTIPNAKILLWSRNVNAINQTFAPGSWWYFNAVTDASNAVRIDTSNRVHGLWNTASQIGCGFNPNCPGFGPIMLCALSPPMPVWNSPIYTAGSPCTANVHCTQPGFNKCEVATGLCYA